MPVSGECTVCGKLKAVFLNRKLKKLVCRSCVDLIRYHNITTWESCFICERLRHVAIRDEERPVCPSCYRIYYKQHQKCAECSKVRPLVLFKELGIALCSTCRSRYRFRDSTKYENCTMCEKSSAVATRNSRGESVCYGCYYRFVRSN